MGVAASFDVDLADKMALQSGGKRVRSVSMSPCSRSSTSIAISPSGAHTTPLAKTPAHRPHGAAVIQGIQSQRVMAMAKHFVGYDTAGTDVWVDEQTLREVYMAPSRRLSSWVASVMCSYNHINGRSRAATVPY